MDYKAIYYKIIEKAKKETENGNRHVGYYEKHHILPKSLGGTNDKENLVKLTAREHFICHWLLVKMYNKGSIERNKMLCALWRMNNTGSPCHKEHYINSRVYEKLRIEFAEAISKITSINQTGEKNSQFGTKWYTNRNTGESKKFKEKPIEDFWIEGRNLFNKHELWSIESKHPLIWRNNKFSNTKQFHLMQIQNDIKINEENTKILWKEFCLDNCSLPIFAEKKNISYAALYMRFKKYIPNFNRKISQRDITGKLKVKRKSIKK